MIIGIPKSSRQKYLEVLKAQTRASTLLSAKKHQKQRQQQQTPTFQLPNISPSTWVYSVIHALASNSKTYLRGSSRMGNKKKGNICRALELFALIPNLVKGHVRGVGKWPFVTTCCPLP